MRKNRISIENGFNPLFCRKAIGFQILSPDWCFFLGANLWPNLGPNLGGKFVTPFVFSHPHSMHKEFFSFVCYQKEILGEALPSPLWNLSIGTQRKHCWRTSMELSSRQNPTHSFTSHFFLFSFFLQLQFDKFLPPLHSLFQKRVFCEWVFILKSFWQKLKTNLWDQLHNVTWSKFKTKKRGFSPVL